MIKHKKCLTIGQIENFDLNQSLIHLRLPKAGDVALFEVMSIGAHTRIQGVNGENIILFEGDRILATFGNRYATKVFKGIIPNEPNTVFDLLGRGGVVGKVVSANAKNSNPPTKLKLLAYAVTLANQTVINTQYYLRKSSSFIGFVPEEAKVVLSLGTTMDSGKTTSAAYLCNGLENLGHKTAYIKLTGTAFRKDADFVRDRGASLSVDFSYFGYPSTYCCGHQELLDLHQSLLLEVGKINPDFIVIEIADGLLQQETSMLLQSTEFMSTIDHIMLSCADSLGVVGSLKVLQKWNIQPDIISGLFTASPMLVEEIVPITNTPILTLSDLSEGHIPFVEQSALTESREIITNKILIRN